MGGNDRWQWQWHGWEGCRQGHGRCCGRATLVMHSAAPDLLRLCPGILGADGAIEWVTSGRGCGRRGRRGGGGGGGVGGIVWNGVGGTVGLDVGKTVLGCDVGQPRPTELQQNYCLSSDHNTSKFPKPSSQL